MIAIIPNELRNAINKKLDAAIKEVPEAEKDRGELYHQLLCYFDEHGIIPDFKLIKKSDNTQSTRPSGASPSGG